MKDLKKVSDWYNAATHTLTSVFSYYVVVYILSTLVGLTVGVAFGPQNETSSSAIIITYLLELISVWLAVYFSSQFLKRRYAIDFSAKKHIINLSTIYTGIVALLYVVIQLILGELSILQSLVKLVSFIPHVIVFCFASKKYLSVTNASTAPAPAGENV